MDYFKIPIERKQKGKKLVIVYPDYIGKKYSVIAFNSDFSEAVIRGKFTKKQLSEMKNDRRVAAKTESEAGKMAEKFRGGGPTIKEGSMPPIPLPVNTEGLGEMLEAVANGAPMPQLPQEPWKEPELLNKWKNYSAQYNPAGYFKDSLGIVHLRGLISLDKKKGDIVENSNVFILPEGYMPEFRELHVACSYSNKYIPGRVDINPDGTVNAYWVSCRWFSLDGITFRAAG